MNEEYKLRIFVSYSGKGRDVWEPLVQLIKELYQCEIIWGQEEVTKYQDPDTMMEEMVKRSDVAIFLLTNDSLGICQEMKLWYRHNSQQFVNAILLKDHTVSTETIKLNAGFEPTYIPFSSVNPWADIHFIFPAINRLLKRGFLSEEIPSWQRQYNKIVHKYNWKIKADNIPLGRIRDALKSISDNPKYQDPENWSFRINWNAGPPGVDSYSNPTDCLKLFDALLQTGATREEYELIFGAINRVMKNNSEPPRKLSGNIIFSSCSISTLKKTKHILGNHPYEKSSGAARKQVNHEEQLPDQPESLLLPKSILTQNDNYERFLASQRIILSVVSKICKYVLCSTVEISASHSFVLSTEDSSDSSRLLAMSCTATRIDKDSLSAISEVPVVMKNKHHIIWFGQPYKKPTSEYRPHWIYHSRNNMNGVAKNVLVHFHPIELVDMYRKVREGMIDYMREEEFIDEITALFRGRGIDFHVFEEYKGYSARDEEFGVFMQEKIKDDSENYSVIWKPNHGVWVFLSEKDCADKRLVEILLTLDDISEGSSKFTSKKLAQAPIRKRI
ncbi:MAG TPA: hypothetical protein VF525_09515 [Pyrinomonadaceae bacterium]|jgi:hypothetical protein